MRSLVSTALLFLVACPLLIGGEKQRSRNLLHAAHQPAAWRIDEIEGGKGMIMGDQDSVQFVVMNVDAVPSHLQVFQGDLDLHDGESYVVSGKIKASVPRSVLLTATIDEDDWHGIGLHEEIHLTEEYIPFEYTFRVSDTVRRKNRLGFIIGNTLGTIWVRDITLKCK
ncbi:hypothetical protein SH661x_003439 [Planctomicrobium sp. SH661]|uniref:hypothetical protein n=1 Tax=Planctomicrobium sp. SH661 TaxID=3448124 RepID=UPI003F5BB08F